jgi:hypothetical protein
MKRCMSVTEFCKYAHQADLSRFIYSSSNQPEWDMSVGFDTTFRSVWADGCTGLLALRSDDAQLRIQNVVSVTVDSGQSILGEIVTIHAVSPIDGTDRRFVLIVS